MNPLTEIVKQFDAAIVALRQATDPERRAKERADFMQPFGETGPYRYAPEDEKRRASQRITRDQELRAGESLYALGRLILDTEPVLTATISTVKEPPTPEQAWNQRAGKVGLSAEAYLQLHMLDEMRHARLVPQLTTSKPSRWLALFEAAMQDPTEQGNATTLRTIENSMGQATWSGAAINPADEPREAAAIQSLRRRIGEAQEARITPELRDAMGALKRAKGIEREAQDLHHILPRNPELEGKRQPVRA